MDANRVEDTISDHSAGHSCPLAVIRGSAFILADPNLELT